jgi:hypothetical protein
MAFGAKIPILAISHEILIALLDLLMWIETDDYADLVWSYFSSFLNEIVLSQGTFLSKEVSRWQGERILFLKGRLDKGFREHD